MLLCRADYVCKLNAKYGITHLAAGLLLEHLVLCALISTVWLGNTVEAMEFPGGSCRLRKTSLIATVLMKVCSISN